MESVTILKRRGQLGIKIGGFELLYVEFSFLADYCSDFTLASSKRELRLPLKFSTPVLSAPSDSTV